MKQLLIIVIVFLAVTAGTTVYFLMSQDKTAPEDIAVTVNGRHFTIEEIDAYFSGRFADKTGEAGDDANHHSDKELMLQTFAEERVLIQEAQRLKIDQEKDFRDKIQRYYEYSLISALRTQQEEQLRRRMATGDTDIEALIDRFLDLYGRPITFRPSAEAEPTTLPFEMIPNMYKPVLADMEPGQTRMVVLTGNTVHELTLDDIGPKSAAQTSLPERDKVRELLLDYRTGTELNTWVRELIDNAAINYRKEH